MFGFIESIVGSRNELVVICYVLMRKGCDTDADGYAYLTFEAPEFERSDHLAEALCLRNGSLPAVWGNIIMNSSPP